MSMLVIHTLLVIQSVWWCCSSSCSGPEICSVIQSAQGFCSALIPNPTSDLTESWSLGVLSLREKLLGFPLFAGVAGRERERERDPATVELDGGKGSLSSLRRLIGSSGRRTKRPDVLGTYGLFRGKRLEQAGKLATDKESNKRTDRAVRRRVRVNQNISACCVFGVAQRGLLANERKQRKGPRTRLLTMRAMRHCKSDLTAKTRQWGKFKKAGSIHYMRN